MARQGYTDGNNLHLDTPPHTFICSCTEIQNRCLNIVAKLFHAPGTDQAEGTDGKWDAVGAATVGSSEAIMLGALALKKRWQKMRTDKGLDISKPNLVMGRNTHVCWQKYGIENSNACLF